MKKNKGLQDMVRAFEKYGFKYLLVGGIAVKYYANPPTTVDVDFIAIYKPLSLLAVYMEKLGYKIGYETQPSAQYIVFKKKGVKIDVAFYYKNDPVVREMIISAFGRTHIIEGVRVASPEDIIIQKLVAWRPKDKVHLRALIKSLRGRGYEFDYQYLWGNTYKVEFLNRRLESLFHCAF